MQKRTKQIIAIVSVVVFLVVIGVTVWSCTRFDFSRIKYEAYDYPAISKYFNQTETDLAKETDGPTATKKLIKAQNYLINVRTQYQLVSLAYDIDMSDSWLQEESTRVNNEYTELVGKYYKLLYIALNNSYISDYIFDGDEEFIADVRAQNASRDETYNRLMTDISKLESDYNNLTKTVSVVYDGATYTSDNLPNANNTKRKEIYNQYFEAYSTGAGNILLSLRDKYNELAVHLGEANYADYAYKYVYDREYTPAEVAVMSEAVKTGFNGMYADISNSIKTSSSVSTSAISSTEVRKVSPLLKDYFREVSPAMLSAYNYMDSHNLYVTSSSDKSYTGAYTSYLTKYNAPYIYQYTNGSLNDISTFVHEFGHFYAFYENEGYQGPMDTCEVQSQASEWLFMPYYKQINMSISYSDFEKSSFADNVFFSLQMGCVMDELQRVIYTQPELYTEGSQVTGLFTELIGDNGYGAYLDYDLYDFKYWWSVVPHSFSSPFYYISYAMSLIPSLEIYKTSITDRAKALDMYDNIIYYGAELSFESMLDYVKLPSPLDPSTINGLADFVKLRCGI